MPGFQPARSTVAARRLQDRGETGRAAFEIAEGVRTGDCEKRDREPLRPSSQTAVYRKRALTGSEEFWYAGPAFPESRRALLLASHWGGPEPKRRKSVNMNSRSFELITRTTSTFTRQPVMLQRAASIAQACSSSRGINPALVRLGSVVTAVRVFLLAMQPMLA